MYKNALFKSCTTFVAMETKHDCSWQKAILRTKNLLKKCEIYISQSPVHLNDTTYSTHSDIVHLRCGTFNFFMRGNVNNGIDDLSRYTFGHFGERIKQLKFLQKYTDPGTETNLLASASVLVANSVNISAWQSLLFIRAVHALTSKIYCGIFW